MDEAPVSDDEIAELDCGTAEGRHRPRDLRVELVERPAAERAGTYVAETVSRYRDTPPPEEALVLAARGGDPLAREALIDQFMPLIVSLARSYRVQDLEFADLVQEGCVGLLRALARFDPDRGTPFGAHAAWWIRQSLQELRSDFMRPLRLPPQALRQLSQLKSEHMRRYAADGREPSLDDLADTTGIDRAQVDALVRADAAVRSLSEPIESGEGAVGVLGDVLDDPVSADAYEDVLDHVAAAQLHSLLSRLSDRELAVLSARFGLDGGGSQRLVDVGQRLGISVERVRQLEQRALAKLRQSAGMPAPPANRSTI